jgi:DNA-directed RNA polymerase subunit RPC12/RpoP
MADALLPEDLVLVAEHCGQPLTWRGSGVRWKGIEVHSERRLRCDTCGLRVVILVTDLDPLPKNSSEAGTT